LKENIYSFYGKISHIKKAEEYYGGQYNHNYTPHSEIFLLFSLASQQERRHREIRPRLAKIEEKLGL